MLPVRWSDEANDNLGDILAYIGHFNPDAADALNDKIDAAVVRFPTTRISAARDACQGRGR
jgi:plasmid stabilization system protein ParE